MPERALLDGTGAPPQPEGAGRLWSRILAEPHRDAPLRGCIDCGICTASCPAAIHGSLSPFAIVQELTYAGEADIEKASRGDIWDCVLCHACSVRCPTGTDPAQLVLLLRETGLRAGLPLPVFVKGALDSLGAGLEQAGEHHDRGGLAELAAIWSVTGVLERLRLADAKLADALDALARTGLLAAPATGEVAH